MAATLPAVAGTLVAVATLMAVATLSLYGSNTPGSDSPLSFWQRHLQQWQGHSWQWQHSLSSATTLASVATLSLVGSDTCSPLSLLSTALCHQRTRDKAGDMEWQNREVRTNFL